MNFRITIQNAHAQKNRAFLCIAFITALMLQTILFSGATLASTSTPYQAQLGIWLEGALREQAKKLSQTVSNSRFEVRLDKIPSLPLTPCSKKPAITFLTPMAAGSQRIKIQCNSPAGWSIYAKGHIGIYVPVLVASHSLARGSTINRSDVSYRETEISTLRRGYLLDMSKLANQQLTRRIRAGDVITPQSLQQADLIRRGDRVSIVASDNNFRISIPGEALENGKLNEQIRVRNLSSGKTVLGTVSGNTEVRVM